MKVNSSSPKCARAAVPDLKAKRKQQHELMRELQKLQHDPVVQELASGLKQVDIYKTPGYRISYNLAITPYGLRICLNDVNDNVISNTPLRDHLLHCVGDPREQAEDLKVKINSLAEQEDRHPVSLGSNIIGSFILTIEDHVGNVAGFIRNIFR